MVFFKEKNKAKENSLSGVLAIKMVMGRIQSFNLFRAAYLLSYIWYWPLSLVLQIKFLLYF